MGVFLTFFVYFIAIVMIAIIQVMLESSGIMLGAAPTAAIYLAVFALVSRITKKIKNK